MNIPFQDLQLQTYASIYFGVMLSLLIISTVISVHVAEEHEKIPESDDPLTSSEKKFFVSLLCSLLWPITLAIILALIIPILTILTIIKLKEKFQIHQITKEIEMLEKRIDKLSCLSAHCLICKENLTGSITVCPTCRTPHHSDCWQYNGGCAIYGCGNLPPHLQKTKTA